jgi:hypothetical protein
MIGRDVSGRRGAGEPRPARARETARPPRTRLPDRSPAPQPTHAWISRLENVTIRVREVRTEIYPIPWFRWQTAMDERTCPECGPLQGRTWSDRMPMPVPPLHVNCRCQVVLARIEWRVRLVPAWRLRTFHRQVGEWRLTGWA